MSKELFEFITPDTFAETIDGVLASGDLYERLWSMVADYSGPTPEESEEPCHGLNSIADFWDRFTPAEQAKLVELQAAQAEKDEIAMAAYLASKLPARRN